MFYFWGEGNNSSTLPGRNATHSEEDWLLSQLQKMHDKFVSQGVPVLLGEFGAMNRTGNPGLTGDDLDLHLASRLYYHELIVDTANSLGIAPFYWDNGFTGTNGSGIFNRITTAATDPDTVSALTGGPGQPGDFNGDGVVDAADYTRWRDNLGGDEAMLNGNGDGMNGVDAGDYTLWVDHFGTTLEGGAGALAGGGNAAVPEPASWLVACISACGIALSRKRRSELG
jgi:hypothetical protein